MSLSNAHRQRHNVQVHKYHIGTYKQRYLASYILICVYREGDVIMAVAVVQA